MNTTSPSDLSKELVKKVVQCFYSDYHMVVVNCLLREPFYLCDDINHNAGLNDSLSITPRLTRQLLHDLHSHGLVQREQYKKKYYWFIHMPYFIKMVKLRLFKTREFIVEQNNSNTERIIFTCRECKRIFEKNEVVDCYDMLRRTLCCSICDGELEDSKKSVGRVDILQKFDDQVYNVFGPLLKRCDNQAEQFPDNIPSKKFSVKAEFELYKTKKLSQGSKGYVSILYENFYDKNKKEISKTQKIQNMIGSIPWIEQPKMNVVKENKDPLKDINIGFIENIEPLSGEGLLSFEKKGVETTKEHKGDIQINVKGVLKRVDDITSEDELEMTVEEYGKYMDIVDERSEYSV
jgi:transcription initiation factor IIE alpha subunit